jgi:hypothetical protein
MIFFIITLLILFWAFKTEEARVAFESQRATTRIVLFDGVCNLCNGFLNFAMDHTDIQAFNLKNHFTE